MNSSSLVRSFTRRSSSSVKRVSGCSRFMRSEISRCNSRLTVCRCSGPGKAMALGMSGIRSSAVTTENCRRNGFYDPRQQVIRMPNRPDLHQVGSSAAQNKESEHPENPVKRKIAPLAHQIDESKGNAVIRKGNDAVGNNMQPDNLRVPEITGPVWQEAGRKQLS